MTDCPLPTPLADRLVPPRPPHIVWSIFYHNLNFRAFQKSGSSAGKVRFKNRFKVRPVLEPNPAFRFGVRAFDARFEPEPNPEPKDRRFSDFQCSPTATVGLAAGSLMIKGASQVQTVTLLKFLLQFCSVASRFFSTFFLFLLILILSRCHGVGINTADPSRRINAVIPAVCSSNHHDENALAASPQRQRPPPAPQDGCPASHPETHAALLGMRKLLALQNRPFTLRHPALWLDPLALSTIPSPHPALIVFARQPHEVAWERRKEMNNPLQFTQNVRRRGTRSAASYRSSRVGPRWARRSRRVAPESGGGVWAAALFRGVVSSSLVARAPDWCRFLGSAASSRVHHQKGQNVPRPCDYHKATQGPNKAHQRFDPTFLVVTKARAPLDQASPTFAAPYERLATFLQRFLSLASALAWGHARGTRMDARCFCRPKNTRLCGLGLGW
ncbi:hypothetical protein C8F04DRAFT_1239992 [Mycena alexandri]|uniref:Uncharacterized protein n=1 Tax=Mycena alexandri TaxID=1745969 RepID=A0AAD6WWI5_9AGAR|nr:hypothetical protein C8F04DRAFT_1239992 [Mycena alexandri]